jgi:hypothetical protein
VSFKAGEGNIAIQSNSLAKGDDAEFRVKQLTRFYCPLKK